MDIRQQAIELFIKGMKPIEIGKALDIDSKKVSAMIQSVSIEERLDNLSMMQEKLNRGGVQGNGYILSPSRHKFLRMAKNGLGVAYKPAKTTAGNKVYRRLGKTYLNQVEQELLMEDREVLKQLKGIETHMPTQQDVLKKAYLKELKGDK